MTLTAVIYLLGGGAALATLLMLFQRDPVKAAMLMLTALLCTAGFYLALSAQLLAALQVTLYAGAVMAFFVVALTVTPQAWRDRPAPGRIAGVLGLAAAAVMLIELLKVSAGLKALAAGAGFAETGTLAIARELFGRFFFQFELLALVLLAAVVGAAALALKRRAAP